VIKNGEAPKADKLRGYFTYTNKSLLESLPDGLERVLDLGCGGGTLGNAYKAMSKAPYDTIIACSLEQLNDPELCLERHI